VRSLRFWVAGLALLLAALVVLLVADGSRLGSHEPGVDHAGSHAVESPLEAPEAPATLRGRPESRGAAPAAEPRESPGAIPISSVQAGRVDVSLVDGESGRTVGTTWVAYPSVFVTALRLERHDGWTAWDDVAPNGCAYALERTAVYPLRRELDVTVTVSEPDARIGPAMVCGRYVAEPVATREGAGRFRLSGVPFMPGEWIRVWAAQPGARRRLASAAVRIPPDPRARLEVSVTMPMEGGHVETDNDMPFEESFGEEWESTLDPRTLGTLSVVALRRDGAPAAGASVRLEMLRDMQADAAGRVRFEGVPAGAYTLILREPGLVPTRLDAIVVAQETRDVVLREGEGGAIRVSVVDEEGRGLPFATIELFQPSGVRFVDLEDGVQRLDMFTDQDGRRRFGHVEAGTVRVSASWGSRRVGTMVDVLEGRDVPVTIVLPAPAEPPDLVEEVELVEVQEEHHGSGQQR
jgi:hypothetical protein